MVNVSIVEHKEEMEIENGKFCTTPYGYSNDLEDAFTKCRSDPYCMAIYDEGCNTKAPIRFCRSFESIVNSSSGSCIYRKRTGKNNSILHFGN